MSALRTLWSLRRRRPRFVAASLAVLAFLLAYPAIHWYLQTAGLASEFRYFDLGAYRPAVNAWQAGEPIYERNEGGGYHGSYLYPPVYLLLFVPFTDVPLADLTFHQAGTLLNMVSLALLWVGLQAAIAGYGLRLAWYERVLLLWAVAGFAPVIVSMQQAQVSVFLAAVISFALAALLYADSDGRGERVAPYLSGVVTAVAGTVKLNFASVGAHLLQDRRRFVGAAGAGVVLLVASLAIFGVDAHVRYYDVLTWGKGWGDARAPFPPYSWQAPYFRPMYYLGSTLGIAVRVGLAGVVAALSLLSMDGDVESETFALGVAAIPLIAPQVDAQDLAVFLPVVVALLAVELRREDGYPLVPVVGLFLAAVHPYGLYVIVRILAIVFSQSTYTTLEAVAGVLQPGLWAAVLLVGLAMYRVQAAASVPGWVVDR